MVAYMPLNQMPFGGALISDNKDALPYRGKRTFSHALQVGLIAQDAVVIEEVTQGCATGFEVRTFTPSNVAEALMRRSTARPAVPASAAVINQLGTLSALLVEWGLDLDARLATLLVGARERTGILRATAPVVALCKPVHAERVAALMTGADFTVSRPIQAAQLQAIQAAYQRRVGQERRSQPGTKAVKGEEPPNGTSEGDRSTGDGHPAPSGVTLGDVENGSDRLGMGPIRVNLVTRDLWIDEVLVALTRRPFDLLVYMIERADRCCTRDELLQNVWGLDFDPSTNVVDVQIYELRTVLAEHGLSEMIETVRGHGYRLRWPI